VSSRGSEGLIIRLPARGYLGVRHRCCASFVLSLLMLCALCAQRENPLDMRCSKIARGLQPNYSSCCLMPATHCACYCYYYYFVRHGGGVAREFYAFLRRAHAFLLRCFWLIASTRARAFGVDDGDNGKNKHLKPP
jgi:hypothetical protein